VDCPLNPLSPIRSAKYDKAEEFLRDLEEVEPRKENYYHRLPRQQQAQTLKSVSPWVSGNRLFLSLLSTLISSITSLF
jgi:hypothetical protein